MTNTVYTTFLKVVILRYLQTGYSITRQNPIYVPSQAFSRHVILFGGPIHDLKSPVASNKHQATSEKVGIKAAQPGSLR